MYNTDGLVQNGYFHSKVNTEKEHGDCHYKISTCMKQEIICSGALFYSLKTKRFLLLHRVQSKQKNVWGLVGGTNGKDESPWPALQREIHEEIGEIPNILKTESGLHSFFRKSDNLAPPSLLEKRFPFRSTMTLWCS